jgi:hypothetical protein
MSAHFLDAEGPALADLNSYYGATDYQLKDLAGMGVVLLNSVATVCQMGHSSPGSTLDYWPYSDDSIRPIRNVHDFIVWTSGRNNLSPGAEDRLREDTVSSGWQRNQMGSLYASTKALSDERLRDTA